MATGVFVAAEFAFVAVDRSRVEKQAKAGSRRARLLLGILQRLSFHLSGAQLGITVTSVILGFIAEPTVAEVLEPALRPVVGEGSAPGVAIALALTLVTVGSMVISELVPKNLSIARPMPSALSLAPVMRLYGLVFGPLIRFLNGASNWAVRRMGIEPQEELASVRSLEELELLIRSSGEEGALEPQAFALLTRSLRFRGKTAAEALVPRLEVKALASDGTIGDLVELSVGTGLSRFPVYRSDLDDIVGVAHVKDVYRIPVEERLATPISAVTVEPVVVPETRDLGLLLGELRERGTHLAVVVDEYGGTAGIITLEDVLEEIVGEIADEYDRTPASTFPQPVGTFVLAGSLHRDEVAEASGFEIPEGDYETLAGFILEQLGHIPEVGEKLDYDGWTIEVLTLDRLRVALVRLWSPKPEGTA